MFFDEINKKLNDTYLTILGINDGCKDNRMLRAAERDLFKSVSILQVVSSIEAYGHEVDKTESCYVEAYNNFYNASLNKIEELFSNIKNNISENLKFLREHFSGYEFCVNEELSCYRAAAERVVYGSERLFDTLVQNISYCTLRTEEELG